MVALCEFSEFTILAANNVLSCLISLSVLITDSTEDFRNISYIPSLLWRVS